MFEFLYDPLTLGMFMALCVLLVYLYFFHFKVESYAVFVEKYPTGLLLGVREDADTVECNIHGSKAAFIKKFEPIVLQHGWFGKQHMRLFLTEHKNNATKDWLKKFKGQKVKSLEQINIGPDKREHHSKMDEVETRSLTDKRFLEALASSKRSTRTLLMGVFMGLPAGLFVGMIVAAWLVRVGIL